jgi:hypothetical protein
MFQVYRFKYTKEAWITSPKNTYQKHGVPNYLFVKKHYFLSYFPKHFSKNVFVGGKAREI